MDTQLFLLPSFNLVFDFLPSSLNNIIFGQCTVTNTLFLLHLEPLKKNKTVIY